MLTPVRSSQFKRDVRTAKSRGKNSDKLRDVLRLLGNQQALPASYRDHPLRGPWKGYRELHLESDWLLIYRIQGTELRLVRTGTHADLFE